MYFCGKIKNVDIKKYTLRRQTNFLKDIDWFTIGLYIVLVLMGWFNIYAAVYDEDHASIFDLSQRYGKQMLWIIAAFVVALVICIIDVHFYTLFSNHIYVFGVISLIAVLVVGQEVGGQRAWFSFGGIQIQPAEFTKITVSLALAKFLGNYNGRLMEFRNISRALAIIFLPSAFILMQPDLGSFSVYLAFFLVLYREGLPLAVLLFGMLAIVLFILSIVMQSAEEYLSGGLILLGFIAYLYKTRRGLEILKGIGIFVGIFGLLWLTNYLTSERFELHELLLGAFFLSAIVFTVTSYIIRLPIMRTMSLFIVGALIFTFSVDFVFDNVLKTHHQQRILVMLGMKSDPLGIEYNVNQSKIAIGSGGLMGKGFLQGTQTKYNFVPEQSTDFIFCTVGEEWGFAGSSAVVILFVILLLRLLFIAERQRSVFSRVYSYSVLCILFLHVTINLGMTVGLLPVIGIPLPFFSYGGSSLWAFTILLFIMLRLDASRGEYIR